MPTISAPMASFLYDAANVGLIVGALLVFTSTIGTVWMGSVKERFSDERIAANEAQTATANLGAAQAREATERLRTANLELASQLEQERLSRVQFEARYAWREITKEQANQIKEILQKVHARINLVSAGGDPEADALSDQLSDIIDAAGWSRNDIVPLTPRVFPPGLHIQNQTSTASDALIEAFTQAGISFDIVQITDLGVTIGSVDKNAPATLFVGGKPKPN